MSTREDYPAGVPCWVDTNQPDPADAARFYSGLFGWQTEDAMPPDAGAHYYMARIDGRDVAAISSSPPAHRRRPCGTPTSASSPLTTPQPGCARRAGALRALRRV